MRKIRLLCNSAGIEQEYVTIINIYAHIRALKYIQQILTDMKGEMDKTAIILRDFKPNFQQQIIQQGNCGLEQQKN